MVDVQNDVQIVSEPVPNKPVPTAKDPNSGPFFSDRAQPQSQVPTAKDPHSGLRNKKNLILLIAVLLLAFALFAFGAYQMVRKEKKGNEIENRNNALTNQNERERRVKFSGNEFHHNPKKGHGSKNDSLHKKPNPPQKTSNETQKNNPSIKSGEQSSSDNNKQVIKKRNKDQKSNTDDGGKTPANKNSNGFHLEEIQ
jgi:uncharacterized protein HemX